ncbi:MAG: AraC family transcriptional regulator [Bacteroidota bacterium]
MRTQIDYKARLNRVFQYIDDHLNTDLSLEVMAEVAAFSPFHFHRIFKQMTDETLNEFINRRRIEKAALDLIHKDFTVAEIFIKHGFNDKSSFSRAFKKFYGVSPSDFRKEHRYKVGKIGQLNSKIGQPAEEVEKYICIIDNLKNWIAMNASIEIKTLPGMHLAYVSCMGPQNMASAYQTLIRWAVPKGLLENGKLITIYHDSYKVTAAHKVRMSACLSLDMSMKAEGEIGMRAFDEGRFIVARFEIGLHEYEKSWTGLFIWMNENGYQKADREPIEIYHNDFNQHPKKKAIVDFCIPVV